MIDNAIPMVNINLVIGISNTKVQELLMKDDLQKHILNKLNKNHLQSGHQYFVRDNIQM